MQQLSITAQTLKERLLQPELWAQRICAGVGYSAKCLPGIDVCSDSLGQSVRPLCGAWYHNVFTADCRSSCHSTKCASCSPPLRRASIGNGRTASHALTRFHWTTDRSICIRLREPRELCMNGRICSHSWIIDILSLSHSLTRTRVQCALVE